MVFCLVMLIVVLSCGVGGLVVCGCLVLLVCWWFVAGCLLWVLGFRGCLLVVGLLV